MSIRSRPAQRDLRNVVIDEIFADHRHVESFVPGERTTPTQLTASRRECACCRNGISPSGEASQKKTLELTNGRRAIPLSAEGTTVIEPTRLLQIPSKALWVQAKPAGHR